MIQLTYNGIYQQFLFIINFFNATVQNQQFCLAFLFILFNFLIGNNVAFCENQSSVCGKGNVMINVEAEKMKVGGSHKLEQQQLKSIIIASDRFYNGNISNHSETLDVSIMKFILGWPILQQKRINNLELNHVFPAIPITCSQSILTKSLNN